MASESSDEWASVTLPADLEEWLDRKATDLGLDRRAVVVQLLASYRATEELADGDGAGPVLDGDDVEAQVRDVVADRIPDIAAAVQDRIDAEAGEDAAAVEERLTAEIDRVETDFTEKLQDVRERVIQVKRETDAKASDDHTHEALEAVESTVDALETAVDDVAADLEANTRWIDDADADLDDIEARLDDVEAAVDRLDDLEERLTTVAWVVSDLREAQQAQAAGTEAVDRLKHAAAELDVDRAVCGNCSEGVEIALLAEPKCPHCETAVSDVEPASGFFGKPTLSVARQLEAGDDADRGNVPDAANGEDD